ncbi:MAG TPA: cell division protein FtsL [Burkholderiales bacterium]
MLRVTLILLAVLVACALGLITSQHKARKLFAELETEQERTRALDVEYGQLQLEASTWSTQSRIERIASQRLRMRHPAPSGVQMVEPPKNEP